jgi:1,4-alpha-glucan branching enzyme
MQSLPDTAAVVSPLNKRFAWSDKNWISTRKKTDYKDKQMNILEVNFALFSKKNGYFTYKEMAEQLITYAKKMRYTHIECMPIMEYFDDASLGYKTSNYYAPTSRYGKPDDLKYFINFCHSENIGVILDWVPGEFSKENHGLIGFDGTGLYEHENEKQGENYSNNTKRFNYGRKEVSNFLIANALYWIEKYHVDGLRLNKVGEMLYLDYDKNDGEWIPNIFGGNENLEAVDFIKNLNAIVKKRNKGIITIAEDSTKWPNVTESVNNDGLGFDFKWNVGWTYDMLGFFEKDPIYRPNVYNEFTFSMLYAYSEQFILCFTHQEMLYSKASLYERMYGNKAEK